MMHSLDEIQIRDPYVVPDGERTRYVLFGSTDTDIWRAPGVGVLGPWTHQPEPLYESDGGHGMIFRAFDGRYLLALHSPNKTPNERARFIELTVGANEARVTE